MDGAEAVRFTLRTGVTFHDGAAFSCAVVKLNFDHVFAEPLRSGGWHGWYAEPTPATTPAPISLRRVWFGISVTFRIPVVGAAGWIVGVAHFRLALRCWSMLGTHTRTVPGSPRRSPHAICVGALPRVTLASLAVAIRPRMCPSKLALIRNHLRSFHARYGLPGALAGWECDGETFVLTAATP